MSTGYGTRYKDSDPLKTIGRIRSILSQLGVVTREDWGQYNNGCYSLNLQIDGTVLFSNGKGTSPAYALASAYGELVERLQNLAFVRLNRGMGKEAVGYRDFCFAPDEKLLSIDELLDSGGEWLSVFTGKAVSREDKKDILVKWQSADFYGNGESFISLPYYNITNEEICHMPEVMLMNMYGSNGMCAGNTAEEALVQGLSEVIERHVMRKIILDRITPPTIPESYISTNSPVLNGIIKRLESKGDFRITVKDCSLGKGFPAVSVIFSDRKSHSYKVKFGAHPVFEIALERCLTELLQGDNINNMNWLQRFSFLEEDIDSIDNMTLMFTNSSGCYPVELFDEKSSYAFTEFRDTGGYDNSRMLSYLIGLLQESGCSILLRDVSFLGFPAFHVVVPFFSEIQDLDLRVIQRVSGMKKAGEIIMRLENANNDELSQVVDYFSNVGCFGSYTSLVEPLHKSLGSAFPWKSIKTELFISMAYYKMGHFKKAYEVMTGFVKSVSSRYSEANNTYFCCMRDYLGALANGMNSETEILNILSRFYAENIVDKTLSSLKNPNEVFMNCSRLECFNCSACQYVKHCMYLPAERLYMKLKDVYARNVINQKSVTQCIRIRAVCNM